MAKVTFISNNPDINENRKAALELIELLGRPPHKANEEDKYWFWQDLDMEIEDSWAKEYVQSNYDKLAPRYPFRVTEWFEEFYRYMPEYLEFKMDGVGDMDWNLFFTLAYPLPGTLGVPFRRMIQKLNLAQLRLVKVKIVNEIYEDKDLRRKVFKWEVIPSIYTNYMPYQTIRKRLIELDKEQENEIRTEIKNLQNRRRKSPLDLLCQDILHLQKQGYTIISLEEGKVLLEK